MVGRSCLPFLKRTFRRRPPAAERAYAVRIMPSAEQYCLVNVGGLEGLGPSKLNPFSRSATNVTVTG
jgi:hypothetical protein